ncbi:MAG: hypothetical protein PF486_11840, partial [Prolixibacteraceae bacterium]|nr:hypothetical protein [Prolixibacteraceae bacterium]
MYRLSFLGIYLLVFQVVLGQSPHGEEFTLDCNDCHTSKNWSELRKDLNFDHRSTGFELMGQHSQIDCKSCHDTLVFSQAPVNCNECHIDMHSNSLGQDCERCHTSESWIVTSINELHDMSRFPLSGAHQTASCMECHETFDQLRFEVTGIECIDCHRQDYLSTQSPNHQENGYSFKCEECHGMSYIGWTGADFNHHFFPLTGGHSISCTECHTSGSFEKLSTECYSCHQQDFEGANNPNHISLGFSQDCNTCHTIQPDWEPAKFIDHDAVSFPIYSGEHKGEWNSCSECHTQPNDYSFYTCIECHEHNQKDMDSEHRGTVGYSYNSTSCYACHPTGNEGSSFNHNATAFPLIGEHTTVDCASCHTQGYAGTPTECDACHNEDFMSAQEPNHVNAGIYLQCQDCHTSSGWSPSQFNHATTGFELSGGHAQINQCSECHIGSLENTSP